VTACSQLFIDFYNEVSVKVFFSETELSKLHTHTYIYIYIYIYIYGLK
jgi:hypothetical protein